MFDFLREFSAGHFAAQPRTSLLEGEGASEYARLLCLSGRVDLARAVLASFGYPERLPPPILGVLIDPGWLAEEYPADPQGVGRMIEACGYSDAPVTDVTLDLLRRGSGGCTCRRAAANARSSNLHRMRHTQLRETVRSIVAVFLCPSRIETVNTSGVATDCLSRHSQTPSLTTSN